MSNHKPIQIHDDDVIVIPLDTHDSLFQQCCFCGLWHKITFSRNSRDQVLMSFRSLSEEPNWDNEKLGDLLVYSSESTQGELCPTT